MVQSQSRKLRSWSNQGTVPKGLLQIFLACFRITPLNMSHMDTKSSILLLDTCTHVTALLIWMVCGTHLRYSSFWSLCQHSTRYRGTVMSRTVGCRAVTNLKVRHFCMICTIAFTCMHLLSNVSPSCAFVPPHHRILKIKFAPVCIYTTPT